MPFDVVTLTAPVVPAATTAVIIVALTTVNEVAAVPPKLTDVAPVKFVPVMVTVCPVPAEVGLNKEIVGGVRYVKPLLVIAPFAVTTRTLPVLPAPTTAVILVALTTLNEIAAVPPKLTAVAPVKFVPVIVTVCPVPAEVGLNEVIVGGGKYVKPANVPVPDAVVTETTPVAPAPTVALILVALTTVNVVAAVPPKLTPVAPVKFVPDMLTT